MEKSVCRSCRVRIVNFMCELWRRRSGIDLFIWRCRLRFRERKWLGWRERIG
jgi:hypothetical protein